MNSKKIFYLSLWIVLGILLSFIFHAFLEYSYLKYLDKQGQIPIFYTDGKCALPDWLQIILFVFGFLGGFLSGKFWWKKIYVERNRTQKTN